MSTAVVPTYTWQDNWAGLNGLDGQGHHGMAVDQDGNIYASFSDSPQVRRFTPDGTFLDGFDLGSATLHHLCYGIWEEQAWIWAVDLGKTAVLKCRPNGEIVDTIDRKTLGVPENHKFLITATAFDPNSGCLWISDGYGWAQKGEGEGNRIYCLGPDGQLRFSFDGSEAPCGIFKEPHGIHILNRSSSTEIYIADRRHHRLVVYGTDGQFLRTVEGDFNTPSAIVSWEEWLIVAELEGRIHLLNDRDEIVATLFDGSEYSDMEGWPNRIKDGKGQSPLMHIEQKRFNSPHGLAVDLEGAIYVNEWLEGTRMTKLVLS